MPRVRIAVAVALLASASVARAAVRWEDPPERTGEALGWDEEERREASGYVELRGGGFLPMGDVDDFHVGRTGEVTVGFFVDEDIALELGVGWIDAETDRGPVVYGLESTPAAQLAVVDARGTLTAVPVTAGLRVFLADGGFRPYLSAGLGVYVAEAGVEVFDPFLRGGTSDATGFGVHAGGGFRAALGRNVSLVADAVYRSASVDFDDRFAGEVDLSGVQLTAGVGFGF